jgi:hypothetical protein
MFYALFGDRGSLRVADHHPQRGVGGAVEGPSKSTVDIRYIRAAPTML